MRDMNPVLTRFGALLLALVLATSLAACDQVNNTAQAVAKSSKEVVDNTRRGFAGFWTLTPKPQPQLPQTRFCYQMNSDIVCYDEPQPRNIARLFGYQEGNNMSFIRQGGGSLGFSAPLPEDAVMPARSVAEPRALEQMSAMPIETSPQAPISNPADSCMEGGQPFACKESPYVKTEPASAPSSDTATSKP